MTISTLMAWTLKGEELQNFETYTLDSDNPKGEPAYDVPVTELNIFKFPNYRKKLDNIESLMASLETQGQLSPILVTRLRHKDDHSLTLFANIDGGRRLEAMRRKAIGSFVDRYNADKGISKKSKDFLSFDDGEWFLKVLAQYGEEVHNTLSQVTVNCNVKYAENVLQAFYASTTSNLQREDAPIGDLIDRIFELQGMGEKRDDIARGLGIVPESVSNYTKVGNLPYYMREYVCSGDTWEGMVEEAKADRHALAEQLCDDMVRRLHLPKNDECSLKFTTLRKLGSMAMYGNERTPSSKSFSEKYLHQDVVLESLKFLCRYDANENKIIVDAPTPDLGSFTSFMQHMEKRSETMRREGSEVIAAVDTEQAAGTVPALPDASGLVLGTPVTDLPITSADVAKAQAVPAAPVIPTSNVLIGDPVDESASELDSEDTDEAEMERIMSESHNEEKEDELSSSVTASMTASKPETMPTLNISPTKVISKAEQFSEFADDEDPDTNPFDRLAFMQTAAEFWQLAGLKGKQGIYDNKFNQYRSSLLEYFGQMEEKAREAGFDLPMPTLPTVSEELVAISAVAQAENEVLYGESSEDEDDDYDADEDFEEEEEEEEEDDFEEDEDEDEDEDAEFEEDEDEDEDEE